MSRAKPSMACDSKPLRNGSSRFKPIQAIYGNGLTSSDRGEWLGWPYAVRELEREHVEEHSQNDMLDYVVACAEAAAGNPAHTSRGWCLVDAFGGSIEGLDEKYYYIWQLQPRYSYQLLQHSISLYSSASSSSSCGCTYDLHFHTSPVHMLSWPALQSLCGRVSIVLCAIPLIFVFTSQQEWVG